MNITRNEWNQPDKFRRINATKIRPAGWRYVQNPQTGEREPTEPLFSYSVNGKLYEMAALLPVWERVPRASGRDRTMVTHRVARNFFLRVAKVDGRDTVVGWDEVDIRAADPGLHGAVPIDYLRDPRAGDTGLSDTIEFDIDPTTGEIDIARWCLKVEGSSAVDLLRALDRVDSFAIGKTVWTHRGRQWTIGEMRGRAVTIEPL